MRFWNLIKCSYKSLMKNKLRSFLSILGIMIGVVTVITVLSVSEAFRVFVMDEYKKVGKNLMWVIPDDSQGNKGVRKFVQKDFNIFDRLTFITNLSPYSTLPYNIEMNGKSGTINIVGTNSNYDKLRNLKVKGRFINSIDYAENSKVCVISDGIRKNYLNKNIDPIGNKIKLKGVDYKVIGYLPPNNSTTKIGIDEKNCIYVPLTSYFRGFEQSKIDMFLFSVKDETNNERYKSEIQQKLITLNDSSLKLKIDSIYDNMKNSEMIFTIVTIVTILITSIGLIVSGIGIMNVLLMAISERKWEIGLRKAVGADNTIILLQFLTESLLLCFIGATVGLAISVGMIVSINYFIDLNVSLSKYAIIASIGFCTFIGIFFGMFPAIKASKLDPLECLEQ